MISFSELEALVRASNSSPAAKRTHIDPAAVDSFICGASNLLVNLTEP